MQKPVFNVYVHVPTELSIFAHHRWWLGSHFPTFFCDARIFVVRSSGIAFNIQPNRLPVIFQVSDVINGKKKNIFFSFHILHPERNMKKNESKQVWHALREAGWGGMGWGEERMNFTSLPCMFLMGVQNMNNTHQTVKPLSLLSPMSFPPSRHVSNVHHHFTPPLSLPLLLPYNNNDY